MDRFQHLPWFVSCACMQNATRTGMPLRFLEHLRIISTFHASELWLLTSLQHCCFTWCVAIAGPSSRWIDSHTKTTLVVTQVDEYKNVMLQSQWGNSLVTTYRVSSCANNCCRSAPHMRRSVWWFEHSASE